MSISGRMQRLKALGNEGGVSRRDFMKFCTALGTYMALGPGFADEVALALDDKPRPSVVYLHCAECTGCTEGLLRSYQPYFDEIIFDVISLDYCETIMAAFGHAAHEALEKAIANPRGYLCVIEGGIPTKDAGAYGKVGGETMLDLCMRVAAGAMGTIAIGSCAAYGGVQAAAPNPSGAKGVADALGAVGVTPINLPGCPPNPANFVGTVLHLLTKGLPKLDRWGRPMAFYSHTVHDNCPRQKHFNAGEFAPSFGSEEARKGWCLYRLGCKGPYTFNNCSTELFNQVTWPVQSGAPCIGCSEPGFWDHYSPFMREIEDGPKEQGE